MSREYWNRFSRWKGWKKLFSAPVWIEAILFTACCVSLIWIFTNGLDIWWPSYIIYILSAYSLAALCTKIPCAVRKEQDWIKRHPRVKAVMEDRQLHFGLKLFIDQFINIAYGSFKIVSGVIVGSAWIGADGIYNFVQAIIQLFQILRRKKPGTIQKQWKSYRFCGLLILLMHLTLIGIVFQMVNWHRVETSGKIMIIATAAFVFYRFVSSVIDLARDRKHTHPIDSSVRMLELSQAIFAMFSLQAGLLYTFGKGENWEYGMNLAAGCVVCLLTVSMGIYMIRRGNREMKQLKEKENGK